MTQSLRGRLAHSEAAAARQLAQSMFDQGNTLAVCEVWDVGSVVSLGPHRYVNRLMCTEATLSDDDVSATIDFFESRDLPASIQITAEVSDAIIEVLARRGFAVDWQRVVLASLTVESGGFTSDLSPVVASVRKDNFEEWLDVLARGNDAATPELRERSNEHARAAHGVGRAIDLLATVDGRPAACGSVHPVGGIAWLGGAATLPEFRGRGLQRALLDTRLDIVERDQYDHVAATAFPESTSSRNLERAGLTIVGHQTVWTRTP